MTSPDRTQTSDDASPRSSVRSEALTPGTMLGRYLVRERLGEGAMGEVYLAYDFALDRRVALKLLHPRPTDTSERLLQEAQAMARLSHPNVVTVHDVGMVAERAFLAMEYVEGPTLRVWLKQPRDWKQLRDVFLGCGRGLAAAHAAGLVHRDFKPENVLVDSHGHARVTDFGVARPSSEQSGSAGTPGYIAPEQRRGDVSPSADQFSFCVTLSEAISAASGVPQRVKAAAQRGRSEDPSTRFPSMDALLVELSPRPSTARNQAVVAIAVLLAAVGLGGLFISQRDQRLCSSGPAELSGTWDGDLRQQLERAFQASPKPYVKALFPETAARLDRWAKAWTSAHRDACEATRIHGTQSQQLLDLRMTCLGARKAEAKALTELLATGEAPSRLERAADAVAGLPSLASCNADELVRSRIAPPADQGKVDSLRARIAQARARHDTGDIKTAEKELRALVLESKQLGYAPVQAEAQIQHTRALLNSRLFKEAEESTFEAFVAAQGSLHEAAAIEAALFGGYASAIALQPAGRWRALATSAVERDGRKLRHLASLEKMRAYTLVREGLPAEALAAAQAALELREREMGKDAPELASELFELAQVLEVLGRVEEAKVFAERQTAIRQKTQGDDHPATALAKVQVGSCLVKLGKVEEGAKIHREVVAVLERAYGKEHPATAKPRANLASALSDLGQHEEAIATARQALETLERIAGSDPAQLAVMRVHVADALSQSGRHAEALPLLEQALPVLEKNLPGGFVPVSSTLEILAEALLGAGRPADALVEADKCIALREKAHTSPVDVANVHLLAAKALDQLSAAGRPKADQHLALADAALSKTTVVGARARAELAAYLKARAGIERASR